MNILLVNPYPTSFPPLGLTTIASHLLKDGHNVKIYEGTEPNFKNVDLIGITGFTLWINQIKQVVNHLSQYHVPIVVGGPCITANPQAFHSLNVDYGVVGEGEETICELANCLEKGIGNSIEGLLVKDTKGFKPRPFMDMSKKLIPAWHLLPNPTKYEAGLGVETSRGCPFNCVFCSAPSICGKVWRSRTPEDIVDEIEFLFGKYRPKRIYFADDNCTVNQKRWHKLCWLLTQKHLPIEFHVPEGIQAHHLNMDTLQLMKKAGFKHIYIGAESGCQRVLDKVIDKGGLKVSQIERVVRDCYMIGLRVSCFFVIGILGETIEEMKQTLAFAQYLRKLGAESCIIRNCLPVPNTRLWNIAKENGNLLLNEEQAQDHNLLHSGKHFLISKEWNPAQVETLVRLGREQNRKHMRWKMLQRKISRVVTKPYRMVKEVIER